MLKTLKYLDISIIFVYYIALFPACNVQMLKTLKCLDIKNNFVYYSTQFCMLLYIIKYNNRYWILFA